MSETGTKVRGVQSKAFTATTLVTAGVPDGTSLEEQFNAWAILPVNEALHLLDLKYQSDGTNYTLFVLYTK